MQFIDLDSQYRRLDIQIGRRIKSVLEHGQYISGPEVAEFEARLGEFLDVEHVIGVGNGTDALQLSLMALNIGAGHAVFVPTFTFFATAEAVAVVGATPVFVDVDEHTFNIDTQSLEEAIVRVVDHNELEPKAIIPVDLFGLPANYHDVAAIAAKYGLDVIEDGAQGLGGAIDNHKACSFGTVATTSFFPAKPLGCYGDGGAIFTSNDALAEKLRSLCVHGKGAHKYDNIRIGLNSRLDTLQAAILLEKLVIFEDENQKRNKIASDYNTALGNTFGTPQVPKNYHSGWASYTVRVLSGDRDRLKEKLREYGIPSNVYYAKPLHLQPAFRNLGYRAGMFPVAEKLAECVLSLPMHPYLTESDIRRIAGVLL